MSIAYIGIGSNLGDRRENIAKSIALMRKEKGIQVLRVSSLYESDPWGIREQPRYLNGVLEMETYLSPEDLLHRLLSIEKGLGRRRGKRWGPRIIDLDLLLYESVVMKESAPGELILPHPVLHRRKFVLLPLLELVPEVIHPYFKRPIKDFLHFLKNEQSHGRVEICLH